MRNVDLSINFAGVTLKNPVVTVSGTCGFGEEYSPYYEANQLGAIAVKGMTLAPRLGNPPPRIAETPSGILNSIGLQNPGVDVFIDGHLPRLKKEGATVIANISGSTIQDYCRMAEILSETDVDFIEMNISCPNVKEGGVAFGTNAKTILEITSEVKKHSKKPIIVKLSPNVTDITEMARAAEAGGADALALINTMLGMRIDIKTKRPILHNNVGGLSGPAIFPVALRMVYQVYDAVKIPLMGMGGVQTARDVIEMMLAGATAVQIGAANLTNPCVCKEIIEQLPIEMEKLGISSLKDIIGGAH